MRIGTPMQLVLWVLSVIFVVSEQWYISWIVTFVAFIIVSVILVAGPSLRKMFSKCYVSKEGQTDDMIVIV